MGDARGALASSSSVAPRQRAVLALRYFESLTDSEIADVLAISAGAVRSTASRALGALRLIYTEDEK
ncbi:sigma factor-like helix-turn-helix DNA-binding protein [Nocardioides nitrophenolicus]|uniref:sigma factor-like helix-turn-helix DNA-binding protein n=1 Tax=Nocardioides nitrophenolicus TaxID=60489 RepID=UPI0035584852